MQKNLHSLTIIFILLLFFFNAPVFGQEPCDEEATYPAPGLTCADAPILCDIGAINGYCAIMPPPPITGNQPSPLCPGNFVANNIIWFGFVASGETVIIEALIEDCTTTPDGQTGVQYGIYTDCSFATAVVCNGNSNTGMITMGDGVTFVPGETYYVFFDGFGGSVCQITVDITEGAGEYNVADPSAIDNDFEGNLFDPPFLPDQVCQGGEIEFFAVDIPPSNTEDYWWTITPATSDYPTGIITVPDDSAPVNDTYIVNLDLSDAGSYEICAYAYTGCDTSLVQCQTIEVVPLGDEVLDTYYVCENEYPDAGPPEWEGGIITGPGEYFEQLEEPLFSCDFSQSLTVESIPLQPEEMVTLAVCDYSFTQMYDICNQTVFGDQVNSYIVCPNNDMNGCDSMIILTLDFINVIGTLLDPVCEDGQLLFSWAGAYPASDNFTTVIFNLYRDNVLVFSADGATFNPNEEPMPVDIESGTYFVEVVVQKFGTECIFSSNLETINVDNLLPETPDLDPWAINPCIQDSISYALAPTSDPGLTYIWDITPSEGLVIADDSSTVIGINWQTGDPNQVYTICVTADNGCGLSAPMCEEINLLAQPIASYSIPDAICITDVANVEYDGSTITSGDYIWNFGGGDIGGADSNAPGPFNVSFSTPGQKIITVSVNQGTCISETYIDSIDVFVPLDVPVVNCGSETDSIGFSWNNLADDYIITVTDAPVDAVFNETDSTFSATGLEPLDEITIMITAVDNGPCGDVTETYTCIAQNCPPIDISLVVPTDTICLDASAGTMDLEAVVDPILPDAVITWSGNGITDQDNGIFDPSSAGVGVHQILFSYENDCQYTSTVNVVVLEQPVSSFTLPDAICITNVATMNYTGTFSTGNFAWDFDGGIATGADAGPFDISWDTPGIKTVTATVSNGNCLSEVFTYEVDVQDTLSAPEITCFPETTEINFSWNDVDNATEYEVFINGDSQGTQSGTTYNVPDLVPGNIVEITVVAISENLCPNTSSFESCEALNCPVVLVNLTTNMPFVCLGDPDTQVQIDSEIIGGQDEADLTWSGPGVNQTGIFDATVAGVGEHEIILEYNVLNCFEYDTILMTVLPTPIASFNTQDVICVSDTFFIEFDGTYDQAATFNWDLDGGNISGDFPGPYKVWYNSAGTFDITLELEENTCLSTPFTQQVTVEDELSLPDPGFDCEPTTNSIVFSWPEVECATSYIIFVNGEELETQTGTEYFVSDLDAQQTVQFEVIAISECACGDAAFDVTCATSACPTIGLDIAEVEDICLDLNTETIQLTVEETGSTGFEATTWIGDGVDQDGVFDPQVVGPGEHQIIYSMNDANCSYTDNVIITIYESPEAGVQFNDPTCPGEEDGTIEIIAFGGDGNYSFFINDEQIETTNLGGLSGGNYTIDIIDGNGCSYSEVVTLTAPSQEAVTIQGSSSIVAGDSSMYSINTGIPTEDITDVTWIDQEGNVICTGADCLTIDYGPEEDVTICATVTYGAGCTEENCLEIRAIKVKQVYIPNVFSPNGDNTNDVFNIWPNDEVTAIPLVQIYNRWGEKMFEATDLPMDGTGPNWDGTFKGKSLNPGVYSYIVNVIYKDGTTEVIPGDLTLIK